MDDIVNILIPVLVLILLFKNIWRRVKGHDGGDGDGYDHDPDGDSNGDAGDGGGGNGE